MQVQLDDDDASRMSSGKLMNEDGAVGAGGFARPDAPPAYSESQMHCE